MRRSVAAAAVPVTCACCAGTPPGYPSATTRARLDATGTPYEFLDAGHDAPLTHPELVAALLLRTARGTTGHGGRVDTVVHRDEGRGDRRGDPTWAG